VHVDNQESNDVKLRNAVDENLVENLIKLPFLNEPAILHCLQQRYEQGLIYTYTGPILIAVNPFKRVNLYTKPILDEYYNRGLLKSMGVDVGSELSPHVYAIADNAYRQMMSVLVGKNDKGKSIEPCNQSILISGESGAGKTESTKVVLSYLTTVGRAADSNDSFEGSVMDKVLRSNPILEAFGNAKTKRNDNSSRFGKFIQLNFNRRGNLIGGSIKTYLLEKVRLPLQQIGERNFHIFYQLVSGSTGEEKLRRGLVSLEDFSYTSKSGVYLLSNINDAEQFDELSTALQTLKFTSENKEQMYDIVAGILHLGQLWFQSFIDGEGEGSVLDSSEPVLHATEMTSFLLGLSKEKLLETLTVRIITAAGETYFKKMTKVQAADARDALAKAIYGKLFDWIVKTINESIEVDPNTVKANIGVLDIFGFESFLVNSFEQLCINYANETLQQQFNQFVFKFEQTEYEKEKIEWSFVQFPDNKDCLELLEHKINGIFAMLDDECRLPKSSDEKFASRMYKEYANHGRFSSSAAQKRSGKFCINHYAGSVEYTVLTFVEKNKDELPKEANILLQSSSNPLVRKLFTAPIVVATLEDESDVVSAGRRKSVGSRTASAAIVSAPALCSVGTQFKEQLGALMTTIYSTSPHYIRCLKPNDKNIADNFNRLRITEQLRYGGVLEAVRVARSGFPVRLIHDEFFKKYRMLVDVRLRGFKTDNFKNFCFKFVEAISQIVSSDQRLSKLESGAFPMGSFTRIDGFQIGLTKMFLRKESHDFMETARYRIMNCGTVLMQSFYRGSKCRIQYRNSIFATRLIQRIYRGHVARNIARFMKRTIAATNLQTSFRKYRAYCIYRKFRFATIILQASWRRRKQIKIFHQIIRDRAAFIVSKYIVGFYFKSRYRKFMKALIILQNRKRAKLARAILRKLKTEAKDLGKLQENNEALKKEIELIKQRAFEERERIRAEFERQAKETLIASKDAEVEQLRSKLIELEELLKSEKRAREDVERKAQISFLEGQLCKRCREKHSEFDHDALLTNDSSIVDVVHQSSRRQSRRLSESLRHSISIKDDPGSPKVNASKKSAVNSPMPETVKLNEQLQSEVVKLRNETQEYVALIESLKNENQRLKNDQMDSKKKISEQTPVKSRKLGNLRPSKDSNGEAKSPPALQNSSTDTPKDNGQAWTAAWDAEEDDSNESGSVHDANHIPSNVVVTPSSPESNNAMQMLEKNIEKWKQELSKVNSKILSILSIHLKSFRGLKRPFGMVRRLISWRSLANLTYRQIL
jgi:myosin V